MTSTPPEHGPGSNPSAGTLPRQEDSKREPPDTYHVVAMDLGGRAMSLVDLSDALQIAIERNYQASQRFAERTLNGEVVDPRPAWVAHAAVGALLDLAQRHVGAQERDLEVLTLSLGTR